MLVAIQKAAVTSSVFIIIAAGAILTAVPSVSFADGWELRTSMTTVPGTRELESGKIAKAIRISKVYLPHVTHQKRVAVLTNLCIGYILSRELDQAETYCGEAVEIPSDRTVSYNNRGILKALQGDYSGAVQDLNDAVAAGCLNSCDNAENAPADLPRPVARRNLDRAEAYVKAVAAPDDEQIAARGD